MRPAELRSLLEDLYRDKRDLRARHVVSAQRIGHYDINNTYQYVIAREDTHLAWLREALAETGDAPPDPAEPVATAGTDPAPATIAREDAADAAAFLARWQARVVAITNARHRRMGEILLGETREHQRFFEQAAELRDNLLGRRHANVGTGGGVLPTRWVG